MFLNNVYFGIKRPGLKAAAKELFGKMPEALSVVEAATLGVLLVAPYRRLRKQHLLLARRNAVISELVTRGLLEPKQAEMLKAMSLGFSE